MIACVTFTASIPAISRARDRVVLGVNTTGLTTETGAALDRFSAQAGVRPKIAMYYQDWDPHWSTALLNPRIIDPILARGAVPMISWTPLIATANVHSQPAYRLSRIVRGAFDPYIKRAAAEAADFVRPVMVNLAPEMNGSWDSYGAGVNGNTPRQFVAMWRHVVTIFRNAGATNVRWVWSPNIFGRNGAKPPWSFYPGNRWVDIVGIDGYNWGHSNKTAWESFDRVFQSSYTPIARLTDKPIIISETGSAETGGNKAQWIRGVRGALIKHMPRVRALVWFNRVQERNWTINSSPSAQRAFRSLAINPFFSGSIDRLLAAPRATRPSLSEVP